MGCNSSKPAEKPTESKPDDIKAVVEALEKVKSELSDIKASTEKVDILAAQVEELKSKNAPVEATASNPVADTVSYLDPSKWSLEFPSCGGVGDAEPAPEPENAPEDGSQPVAAEAVAAEAVAVQ